MRNQIFIPANAEREDDLLTSWGIQEPLINSGYSPGLMLVLYGGILGVTEHRDVQYDNLKKLENIYGNLPIVVMLSNIPIAEIDFLNNTEHAIRYAKSAIDFARNLPIGGRRIVTFHLHALVKEIEFLAKSKQEWIEIFRKIIHPSLLEICAYSNQNGVEVKIETVPVPEWGDIPDDDKRTYRGAPLNTLRDPFYLTGLWGFDLVRETGLGICLDICHNQTIYVTARHGDPVGILHLAEINFLKNRTIVDDINSLNKTDLVHLNDGAGMFSKKDGRVFKEGVTLGEGEIKELDYAIELLDQKQIPYVLEVYDDGDYINRPQTQASIQYLTKRKKRL